MAMIWEKHPRIFNGRAAAVVILALVLTACGKGYDTHVSGELSYMPMLGADSLLLEYEPSKFAVIYVSDETRLINIDRAGGGIVWSFGGDFVVDGDKTTSVEDFAKDGVINMTSSKDGDQTVDLWINAAKIEKLANNG